MSLGVFFFSSRRRHTRFKCDWSSDVCSSDLMVAQEPDLVAASAAYLSSFKLPVTEATERANLPVLTLSYSDLITDRGFKYVFQTSPTAGSQAKKALPQSMTLAEAASCTRPKTVAIITDHTAAS